MTKKLEIKSCSIINLLLVMRRQIRTYLRLSSVGPMSCYHYGMVQHKLNIIYDALIHIHLIQTLNVVNVENQLLTISYQESNSVVYFYIYIKACKQSIIIRYTRGHWRIFISIYKYSVNFSRWCHFLHTNCALCYYNQLSIYIYYSRMMFTYL